MANQFVKNRHLNVFINTDKVGELYEGNGLWSFEYTPEWLGLPQAFPLTPSLALHEKPYIDSGTDRPVQWFFDNLLPEEAAREVLAKDFSLNKEDAFSLLEAVGAESAGSVTLLKAGERLEPGKLFPLTNVDISERIRKLPTQQMNRKERKRMSLAGAQHKMLLVIDEGQKFEPSGLYPSSHILKPEYTDTESYPFTVRNEYFTMRLAQLCGLEVPDVAIEYVPEPIFIIRRFDRTGVVPHLARQHVLDGCQLLDISASAKYRASHVEALNALIRTTRTPAKTAIRLLRWVIFNFVIGNGDAHLKNLSFTFGERDCRLLPHYDLLSTVVYAPWQEHLHERLSQPIGDALYFGDVSRQEIIKFAKDIGIKERIALKELELLVTQVQVKSDGLIHNMEALPNYLSKAGELRLMRDIRYRCIAEFSQQVLR